MKSELKVNMKRMLHNLKMLKRNANQLVSQVKPWVGAEPDHTKTGMRACRRLAN